MFWKKQQVKEEEPKQVKCEECKHYIDREDAQKIDYIYDGLIFLYFYDVEDTCEYYCPLHKKPYTKLKRPNYLTGGTEAGNRTRYYKELEVTEQGEPIGYKKIK